MTLKLDAELNQLKKRKVKLNVTLKTLGIEQKEAQRKYQEVKNKVNSIKVRIHQIEEQNTELSITDHALIRYIERVLGICTKKFKDDILTDKLKVQVLTTGSGQYPICEGHKAVVKNKTIISIV